MKLANKRAAALATLTIALASFAAIAVSPSSLVQFAHSIPLGATTAFATLAAGLFVVTTAARRQR